MIVKTEVRWVSPEAPTPMRDGVGERRVPIKENFRLGVLDNAKSNADHLLEMLIKSLQESVSVGSVIRRRKPGPAFAAKAELLDELAMGADLVVSAMAD